MLNMICFHFFVKAKMQSWNIIDYEFMKLYGKSTSITQDNKIISLFLMCLSFLYFCDIV